MQRPLHMGEACAGLSSDRRLHVICLAASLIPAVHVFGAGGAEPRAACLSAMWNCIPGRGGQLLLAWVARPCSAYSWDWAVEGEP